MIDMNFKLVAAVSTLLCAGGSNVLAIPLGTAQLRLSTGFAPDTRVILDNSDLDSDKTLGVINFAGPVGSKWVVNMETGLTKPALGAATSPFLNITSVNQSNGKGIPDLTIEFSDIGFGGLYNFTSNESGTKLGERGLLDGEVVPVITDLDGSAQFRTYLGTGNNLFEPSLLLTDHGIETSANGSSGFDAGTEVSGINGGYLFSLTMQTILHHKNGSGLKARTTSFNSSLQGSTVSVPEAGSTLLLAGASLAGMVLVLRRQSKTTASTP